MTLYVDTSVILRWVLGQPNALRHPPVDAVVVTSRLTTVETTRSLDRLRRQGLLADDVFAERHGTALRLLARLDRVHLHVAVLRRAGDPFPVPLGTLDALHLARGPGSARRRRHGRHSRRAAGAGRPRRGLDAVGA